MVVATAVEATQYQWLVVLGKQLKQCCCFCGGGGGGGGSQCKALHMGDGGVLGRTIDVCSWWGWWRKNRNVVVVVEGKQLKCVAGGGGGLGKTIECVPSGGWCRENNRNMAVVLVLV